MNGSKIDYIIVTKNTQRMGFGRRGLHGDEIEADAPTVHTDLAPSGDFEVFRRRASDHFPLTVDVAVTEDSD